MKILTPTILQSPTPTKPFPNEPEEIPTHKDPEVPVAPSPNPQSPPTPTPQPDGEPETNPTIPSRRACSHNH